MEGQEIAISNDGHSNGGERKGDSLQRQGERAGVGPSNHGQDACAINSYDPELKVRMGAYLPHWTREGATYFLTFRLADSLPAQVLKAWEFERNQIRINSEKLNRPLTDYEKERLDKLFSEKVEAYLDAGSGACWLKRDEIAAVVAGALNHFNGTRYHLYAWAVMPNHVHAVVQPIAGHELSAIVHSWKSFTASRANKLLKRGGPFWQPEPYDHLIRDEADFHHAVRYTYLNPEKANLKDWKWRWIFTSTLSLKEKRQ